MKRIVDKLRAARARVDDLLRQRAHRAHANKLMALIRAQAAESGSLVFLTAPGLSPNAFREAARALRLHLAAGGTNAPRIVMLPPGSEIEVVREHVAEVEARVLEAVSDSTLAAVEPPPDSERGLYGKFLVRRADGKDLPGGPKAGARYFVLDLTHDVHALPALRAYAAACAATHPALATDLLATLASEARASQSDPNPNR